MNIGYTHALSLETVVRDALHCESDGYGGLVHVSSYEEHPFDAAVICIGALYREDHAEEIQRFVGKWWIEFDRQTDTPEDAFITDYINDLKELVTLLKLK